MRIRGEAGRIAQLVPEVLQMPLVQAAFQVRPRIVTGRGMTLKVHQVSRLITVRGMEKMIQAYLDQSGQRRVRRNVPANSWVVLVGTNHHGQRIPANETLEAALQRTVTRIRNLLLGGNGIDVRRIDALRGHGTRFAGAISQAFEQVGGAVGAGFIYDLIQGLKPLRGFLRVQVFPNWCFRFQHS